MTPPLEDRFESFLCSLPSAAKLAHNRPDVKEGESQADFLLADGRVVVEMKTLKNSQLYKGEAVVDEYIAYTGGKLFGTLPLSHVAQTEDHLASIEKTVAQRMTRGIESICKSAHKQIRDEFARLPRLATGLLVLINEDVTELHPSIVADRVASFTTEKATNIHYCLLIFESHKVRLGGARVPYPLLLDFAYSARQRRARPVLADIQDAWARINGFPDGLPSLAALEIAYEPTDVVFGR